MDPLPISFIFLALGHFVIDLYPAFLPALLPLLIDQLGISFTSASLLAAVLSLSASFTQPLFGFLFDRLGGGRIIILGPLLAGLTLSFLPVASHYFLLVILLGLGGLGVSAYHPEGATLATSLCGQRKAQGISLFMLGGNVGYSLGPSLIVLIVTKLGAEWSFLAALPALGIAWLLYRNPPPPRRAVDNNNSLSPKMEFSSNGKLLSFVLLFLIVLLRVTTVLSFATFLPVLQRTRGFSLMIAGGSMTVFMLCGAVGGVLGGYLTDRFGRRHTIVLSLALTIPTLAAFLLWKGPASFFILAFLGFLLFVSEPSCIILAQEMIPQQARTASGLIMGMAWGLASLGVLGTGALADATNIEWALRFLLFLPIGSTALSLFLPRGS